MYENGYFMMKDLLASVIGLCTQTMKLHLLQVDFQTHLCCIRYYAHASQPLRLSQIAEFIISYSNAVKSSSIFTTFLLTFKLVFARAFAFKTVKPV